MSLNLTDDEIHVWLAPLDDGPDRSPLLSPDERERQKKQQREPQVELESKIESLDQVRPGRFREGFVKRRPKAEPEGREHGEVDRGRDEQEAGERRKPVEHFRGDSRRLAPMSRTAT